MGEAETLTQQNVAGPKRRGRPKGSETRILHQSIAQAKRSVAGISNNEVAKIVGCQPSTVSNVLAKYGINQEELTEYKTNRADIFAGLQKKIAQSLNDEPDLKKVPYRDRVIGLGVIGDKERLERGESTTNLAGIVKVLMVADQGL